MDCSNGNTLIESMYNIRSEDVPYALKHIDSNTKSILQWFKVLEREDQHHFVQKAVLCYLHLLPSVKLSQAFMKILMSLPNDSRENVKKELEVSFECLLKDINLNNNIKTFCELFNQSQVAKESCRRLIKPTSEMINNRLSTEAECCDEAPGSDSLYYLIKICIQCLQTCGETLKSSFHPPNNETSSTEIRKLWEGILSSLLSIFLQNSKQELLGLLGTAMAMTVNLSSTLTESITAYKEIINMILTGIDQGKSQHLSEKIPSSGEEHLRVLLFIKGLLLTGSKELLCDNSEQPLLFHTFPVILSKCRGPQEHHYVAFQVLSLFFQKFRSVGVEHFLSKWERENEIHKQLQENKLSISADQSSPESFQVNDCRLLMSSGCTILTSTVSTVWLNWDSPVTGVAEYAMSIFDCLLNVWAQAVADGISFYSHFSSNLMDDLLTMSWSTKTRYRPMCILLPFVDVYQLVEDNPELKEDLLKCMNINVLAAVSSDVYRAVLTQMAVQISGKKKNLLTAWVEMWMPTLLKGIMSVNSVQQSKVCTYWIPHTLKIIGKSEVFLLETLELEMEKKSQVDYIKNLFAWTTICRYARELLGMTLEKKHYKYIQEASVCSDEYVRVEALFLLCCTLRRATPVEDIELKIVKSFISVNIKADSSSFRQSIISAMKKMIIRIRDSCSSDVKLGDLSKGSLDKSIDFIDWLVKFLFQSLFPGGSYQRRQTTLDLLEIVFHLLVYQENCVSKKGKAKPRSNVLMDCAKSKVKWNFFSFSNFSILLSCLEDGAEDIQTQCFQLLLSYFPWPTSPQWMHHSSSSSNSFGNHEDMLNIISAQPNTVCNFLNRSFDLASSPKSFENHSGLLLISLVYKIYVLDIGLLCVPESHCVINNVVDAKSNPLHQKQCLSFAFIDMLLQFLETSVSAAKADPGIQFKSHSIHGLTQYITVCIKQALNIFQEDVFMDVCEWSSLLKKAKDLNEIIIDLILDVLSGGGNLQQCPSFAQMGEALENLISGTDDNQDEVTSLSPDFQLLLSWCWINLKESCSSLGQVVASSVKGNRSLLPSTAFSEVGQKFVKVLTTCRHRGAIEGCRTGFSQFCETLLSSKNKEYQDIPKTMLNSVFQSLSENSLTTSISRRSAGLPIIIEIVTNQVVKTSNDKHYLGTVVDRLYSVAAHPLCVDHNQQQDLSQVHALNILKVVFCNASLASHLGPLLSKLTILVIENFDSPSWAIRNAATQLISTLVSRIFGQRNKISGSMTLEEFSSLYPDLLVYILEKLQTFRSSKSLINPSLYILLTLLSNLVMSPSNLHHLECRRSLQLSVSSYLQNPVHSLRNLSAQAYVALFELDKVDEKLRDLLTSVINSKPSLNVRHGFILCVHHLITADVLSKSMFQETIEIFCKNEQLLHLSDLCYLPSTQVVLILKKIVSKLCGDLSKETSFTLWSLLESLISKICHSNSVIQPGAANCMTESFCVMKLLASQCTHLQPKMVAFICNSLVCPNADLNESIMSTLSDELLEGYMEDQSVQEALWQFLMRENNVTNFVQTCDILHQLHDRCGHFKNPKTHAFLSNYDLRKKWDRVDCVKASILIVDGICYHDMQILELLQRCVEIQLWCDQVLNFGNACRNENLRFSAARALRKGGNKILDCYRQLSSNASFGKAAVSIIRATMQFLEDSEVGVRNEASVFVSHVAGFPALHANLAVQVLSQFISQNLYWSEHIQLFLLDELSTDGDLTSACQNAFSSDIQRLFEPEMESILFESHARKSWAYLTLKAILRDAESQFASILDPKRSQAGKELEKNIATIASDLEARPFFNVTSNPKVLVSLQGIVLVHKLCQECTDERLYSITELHKSVTSLLQMPHIHPLLKDLYMDDSLQMLQEIDVLKCSRK